MLLPVLNGMIAIMLAKFAFNDVPHYLFEETTMRSLKVTYVDERGATGPQLRYIALLSARLKIPEPVVKEFGEAGRMITHLKKEEQERKRLKSNPAPTGKPAFENLPIAYHGFESSYKESKILFVTPDIEIAKTHGRYVMEGRVLPEKLMPDPEVEGFEGRELTGLESFNLVSARVPVEYFWPDSEDGKLEYMRGL